MKVEPEEILLRIAGGEGKELEFKRGLPRDPKTARTLCAFANTRGGLLLIGVGDRGALLGAPKPREVLARLRAIATERLDPVLAVEVGLVGLRGVRVVWCSVPLSPRRPHTCSDEQGRRTVLVRAGSSNRVATGATLRGIQPQRTTSLDPLHRQVLEWVERRQRPGAVSLAEAATVAAFARDKNVGLQRARRAFTQLELAGRLVGHGTGARRVFAPA